MKSFILCTAVLVLALVSSRMDSAASSQAPRTDGAVEVAPTAHPAAAEPSAVTFCTAGPPVCVGQATNQLCGQRPDRFCFFVEELPDGGILCSCSEFPQ